MRILSVSKTQIMFLLLAPLLTTLCSQCRLWQVMRESLTGLVLVLTSPEEILKGTNTQHHMWSYGSNIVQTELMAEIYSNCPDRAIGKVLIMKFTNQST